MPLPVSPTRRVLGEKDANASLNTTSPKKIYRTEYDVKPKQPTRTQHRAISEAIKTVPASPRAGQKRRISEVEGVEARDWDVPIQASQATDIVSDSASEADRMDTSIFSSKSAAETTGTSFGMSTSQENAMEPQFELLEPEMSQRTLDKIHAVTLPQNQSQPSQLPARPELTHNISQDSVGMAAFLNFHSDPSSQASDGIEDIQYLATQGGPQIENINNQPVKPKELTEEEKRKAIMDEKAAQLRTRLQLAFFKVETRQTNTPFSRLKVPESHRRRTASPPSLLSPSNSSHKPQSQSISTSSGQRTGFSPEARIAALRAQATMQQKPKIRSLESLPMPHIKPTAFSARWADNASGIEDQNKLRTEQTARRSVIDSDEVAKMPSSPPLSDRSLQIHEDATATTSEAVVDRSVELKATSALAEPDTPALQINSNEQLSSPPPSQADETECVSEPVIETAPISSPNDTTQPTDKRLAGSLGHGEAASGLLQLMRSGTMNAGDMRGSMCGL